MGTAAQSPAPGGGRLLSLDVLRGLAVLLVLGSHMGPQVYRWGGPVRWFLAGWNRGGWIGVDLFFVLSGFLVSGLLFAEHRKRGRLSVPRFYVRRGFKIYPAFFCLVAFKALYLVLVAHRPPGLRPFLVEACFLQSYLPGFVGIYTWSLAVEEHFYLVLPWLLLLLAWRDRGQADPFRPLVGVVAGAAGLCLALRVLAASRHGFDLYRNIFPTHLRIDSLLFGVLIAYAYHYHRDRLRAAFAPWTWALGLGGAACLAPAFLVAQDSTPGIYTAGLTLFYLGSGALLIAVLLRPLPPLPFWNALAFVGVNSYSIYLWHFPYYNQVVQSLIPRLVGPLNPGVALVLYVAGSVAFGALMAHVVEYPVLRVRNRWFPSRTGPPLGAPSPAPPVPEAPVPALPVLKGVETA